MKVSILIPSRNGIEFLNWSYKSIRKNQGRHVVEILVLDDISDKDNTWDWCVETMDVDPLFKAFKNESPKRMGISGGHKFLSEKATMEIICHWHNDMYLTSGALDEVSKHLYHIVPDTDPENHGPVAMTQLGIHPLTSVVNDDICVCLTRIEHSMGYQPGLEKIVWENAPLELDEWNETEFLNDLPHLKSTWGDKVTGGHFAPYFMSSKSYKSLGSNDDTVFPLQAREDSDFGFRLVLSGIKTVQIPAFVFHYASRGNRRNKYETDTLTDNPDWIKHDIKATRNFIRKWQTFNLHDALLTPTPPVRYDILYELSYPTIHWVEQLEPWCDKMKLAISPDLLSAYIEKEQQNTVFDLNKKFSPDGVNKMNVIVKINCSILNELDLNILKILPCVIYGNNEVGRFSVTSAIDIEVLDLASHEKDLIGLDSDYYISKLIPNVNCKL